MFRRLDTIQVNVWFVSRHFFKAISKESKFHSLLKVSLLLFRKARFESFSNCYSEKTAEKYGFPQPKRFPGCVPLNGVGCKKWPKLEKLFS